MRSALGTLAQLMVAQASTRKRIEDRAVGR